MPPTNSGLALLDAAERLFLSDPLVAYLTLVVSGAQLAPVVVSIDGREVLLPDWGDEAWRWYGETALELAGVVRELAPRLADDVMVSSEREIRAAIADSASPSVDTVSGPALALWAIRILRASAPILGRVGRAGSRVARAAWARVRVAFGKAPVTITAATLAMASPDAAEKIVKAAVKLASGLFSHAAAGLAKGIAGGLGPLGLLAIGVGLYLYLK